MHRGKPGNKAHTITSNQTYGSAILHRCFQREGGHDLECPTLLKTTAGRGRSNMKDKMKRNKFATRFGRATIGKDEWERHGPRLGECSIHGPYLDQPLLLVHRSWSASESSAFRMHLGVAGSKRGSCRLA